MNTVSSTKKRLFYKAAILLFALFALLFPFLFAPTTAPISASAASGDVIKMHEYRVEMDIQTDRKVRVQEWMDVEFYSTRSMFYRALPIESTRYFAITAKCLGNSQTGEQNSAFDFEVADNPDIDGFIDFNCRGGTSRGKRWTYYFSYTMENGWNAASGDNGMILDVIGFGATVDIHNVKGTLRFPYAVDENSINTYVGYGNNQTQNDLQTALSADKKTFTFTTDKLSVNYNPDYDIYVADGVSVDFCFAEDYFDSYFVTRSFNGETWIIVLGGVVAVAAGALIALLLGKKREIVTVVNLKAPDDMDPLKMGKLLDGVVDNEDITSMIYYFAHKGYMQIDLSSPDEPIFIKKVDELPENAPYYQKTLFDGLFERGDRVTPNDLQNHFYKAVERALLQVPKQKMYDTRSVLVSLSGSVIAVLFTTLICLILAGMRIGNGYAFGLGITFFIPLAIIFVLRLVRENYRYKWKKWLLNLFVGIELIVAVIFTLLFVFLIGNHVATEFEKLAISAIAFGAAFATKGLFSRTEQYCQTLGHILGFKEFIVVTEEDKIKFMLQENPELYFKILPYAQVLGVTNEWESKFANITMQPPTWCTGDWTVFDYMLVNRCMRTAMITSMRSPDNSGGRGIGGTGGGGSFGGFGGGGFGGGGFGTR